MNVWKTGLIALLGCSTLIGCETLTGGRPEWVDNPKVVYPEELYLVAVGEGDTRQAAENSAAAKLSRVFESRIESNERLLDQSTETLDSFVRTTDFTSDVNILSSQTLYNIQNAEAWKDELGRYHAVAYLERRSTAAIYRGKIDERATRVNYLLASAANTDDALKRYATLRAAHAHALEADGLLRQLKVIHPRSIPDATPGYSMNRMRDDLVTAAKAIKVRVAVSGDEDQRVSATVKEFITGYGFTIGEPPVLDLVAKFDVIDTGERDQGLVFVRYDLTLQIRDAGGDVLVTVRDKGREAHKTMAQARTRSLRTLENSIKAGGAKRLDTYFDSLVEKR